MSRGVYRGIYSALPDDADFQLLSPDARLLLLVARVCHQAGPAAIFRYYAEILRAQTGLSVRRLEAAFVELEGGNWLYRDGGVLWIRNGLRHDPSTTLANENHRKSVNFWLKGLPKVALVLKFCDYYQLPYPFEAHEAPHDVGPTQSKEKESESEKERESEKDTTSPPPAEPAVAMPPSWGKPEHLVSLFNRLAPNGHPRVTKLSPARASKARSALTAFPEQKFWTGVFSELALSRFLQHGSRERPDWRADFDWLLTKGKDGSENAVKVFEGRYRDKEHA